MKGATAEKFSSVIDPHGTEQTTERLMRERLQNALGLRLDEVGAHNLALLLQVGMRAVSYRHCHPGVSPSCIHCYM